MGKVVLSLICRVHILRFILLSLQNPCKKESFHFTMSSLFCWTIWTLLAAFWLSVLSSGLYMRSILHMQVWKERFLVHTSEYWIISHGHPHEWIMRCVPSVIKYRILHLKCWINCLYIFLVQAPHKVLAL